MARIAIFGGTGYVGSALVQEARSRGHEVVVIARSADATVPDGVELRTGSVHDARLVDAVVEDADVVVLAVPGREIDERRLVDALPALEASCSRTHTRLAVVGGAGSLRTGADGPRLLDTPDFPEQAKPEAEGMLAVLEALRDDRSGIDWFFLSPAATFGAWAPGERTGSYRTGKDVLLTDDNGDSAISGADFAIAFLDEIDNPQHRNERFTVAY